jgi:Txe/YoeB family toxin of toxin-antitoxin system
MYRIVYTKKALKDIEKLKSAGLSKKGKQLVELIKINPYESTPSYEKLVGDLSGAYSRRINIKHRLAYSVDEQEKVVKIIGMWTYYE